VNECNQSSNDGPTVGRLRRPEARPPPKCAIQTRRKCAISTAVDTESIEAPYSTEAGRALEAAGFLVPLRVHSGMDEIEELADDVLSYLGTAEGAELLIAEHGGRRHDIHVEKLPHRLGRLAEMHPEKLPYEIRHMLQDLAAPSERGGEWLRVGIARSVAQMA